MATECKPASKKIAHAKPLHPSHLTPHPSPAKGLKSPRTGTGKDYHTVSALIEIGEFVPQQDERFTVTERATGREAGFGPFIRHGQRKDAILATDSRGNLREFKVRTWRFQKTTRSNLLQPAVVPSSKSHTTTAGVFVQGVA